MTRTFWEHCLHASVWMTIRFGLLFAGAGVPGLDGGARSFYWVVSGGAFDVGDFDARGMRILVSLVGAVMLGWSGVARCWPCGGHVGRMSRCSAGSARRC